MKKTVVYVAIGDKILMHGAGIIEPERKILESKQYYVMKMQSGT